MQIDRDLIAREDVYLINDSFRLDIVDIISNDKENTFISSSAINELFLNGVDISPLVPKVVLEEYLKNS